MNSTQKHIAETVLIAKREIDSGDYDKPIKNKKRMKIVLVDGGSIGKYYKFAGKFSGKDIHLFKKINSFPKHRDYEKEEYGVIEK